MLYYICNQSSPLFAVRCLVLKYLLYCPKLLSVVILVMKSVIALLWRHLVVLPKLLLFVITLYAVSHVHPVEAFGCFVQITVIILATQSVISLIYSHFPPVKVSGCIAQSYSFHSQSIPLFAIIPFLLKYTWTSI